MLTNTEQTSSETAELVFKDKVLSVYTFDTRLKSTGTENNYSEKSV